MATAESEKTSSRSIVEFFALILVLSVPFWLLGALGNPLPEAIPINLPISSLMAPCPVLAALILTHHHSGQPGVRALLLRALDYRRIGRRRWYLATVLLMPAILVASYLVMRLIGSPLPDPEIPVATVSVLVPVFLIAAAGEELGWSGYATDPLRQRWGALTASVILGLFWALWHVLPYLQAGHSTWWIGWQCFNSVGLRTLIVWIYYNTGRSVFAAITFHAMSNVSEFAFPNNGSYYNPCVTGLIIVAVAIVVSFLWGPQTLARYRFARPVRPAPRRRPWGARS